uniref:Uncharacterized protein n=1 Tax=Knipowitschia caucasica TaxID=637954 RepID=A0AAV2K672_KNICA
MPKPIVEMLTIFYYAGIRLDCTDGGWERVRLSAGRSINRRGASGPDAPRSAHSSTCTEVDGSTEHGHREEEEVVTPPLIKKESLPKRITVPKRDTPTTK